MYDVHKELNEFYNEHVRLPNNERQTLAEHRDINLRRLQRGLEELGNPHCFEHRDQGSYAMRTINQRQRETDYYDIDVSLIFAKDELPSTALDARKRIEEALCVNADNFNTPPEALPNAVRVYYEEDHHIDLAVYRTFEDDWGNTVYEHAGPEWTRRDPMEITNWFNATVRERSPSPKYGATIDCNQMRRIVCWLKYFAKSRESWQLPGGLIISALVAKCYRPHPLSDDVALYDTMVAIHNRLHWLEEVSNPVDSTQSLTEREKDKARVRKLHEKLGMVISKLKVLFDSRCTEEQAIRAWHWVFQHPFWSTDGDVESIDARGKRYGKAAMRGPIFVTPTGTVTTRRQQERHITVPRQKFYGPNASSAGMRHLRACSAVPVGLQWLKMQEYFSSLSFTRENNVPTWYVSLQPTDCPPVYTAKIAYKFTNRSGDVPKVWIVEPEIHPDAPHRYSDDSLCLYYPPERSWTPDKFISETIVPWTALWLLFYEIWLDADHWYGPEAPHDEEKRR